MSETTYSHVHEGRHLRMVTVVKIEGDVATVRAIAGRMAGMTYEVDTAKLVPMTTARRLGLVGGAK